jgi:hypothetical protein
MLGTSIAIILAMFGSPVMSADVGTTQGYQVVESNVPDYEVGKMLDKLPDRAALPLGGYVRVLHGSTTTLIEHKRRDEIEGGTRDLPSKRE